MEFNYGFGVNSPGGRDPDMDVKWPNKAPRIRARGNLKFLDYIDLIEYIWKKGNPEVIFQPMGAKRVYDPERAYLIYELDSRVPKDNNTKPRHQETFDHPDDPNRKVSIYTQSFNNLVSFTALHQNPRTAEEIIEDFEDFMMEACPIFKGLGIEEFIYNRRISDRMDKKYGEDLSARTVLYMVTTQKTMPVEQRKLQEVIGQLTVMLDSEMDE
jgi:hypothetical protein